MHILVVEDDDRIGAFVRKGLSEEGHVVDLVADGDAALTRLLGGDYDVAVVDWMIPGPDGLSVVEQMRAAGVTTPALMLSAKRDVGDRVQALQRGADDFLTKPFSFAELAARVEALGRRNLQLQTAQAQRLAYGGVELDLRTRRVTRDGVPIELQPKELALLEYLLRRPERVVSRTMLLEHVWGYDFDPQTNVVDVLVSRLRKKIDRDFDHKLIHTLRGRGYMLRQER